MQFLFLIVAVAFAKEASQIVGNYKCLETPKFFSVSETRSKFQEISITSGYLVRIKSKAPNEAIEIDCSKLATESTNEGGKWKAIRQEKKISFWDFVIPGLLFSKARTVETTLTNINEFPIESKINIRQRDHHTSITLTQSPWTGNSIVVSCDLPGVGLSIWNGKKLISQYQSGRDEPYFHEPFPPPGYKNEKCKNEMFYIDLGNGVIAQTSENAARSYPQAPAGGVR